MMTSLESDDELYCGTCNGSGEGMYDGSRCDQCRGTGIQFYRLIVTEREEIEADDRRDREQDQRAEDEWSERNNRDGGEL